MLYAGEVGGVDTLGSGVMGCSGVTLGDCGGDRGKGSGAVTDSSSLALESSSKSDTSGGEGGCVRICSRVRSVFCTLLV